MATDTRPKPSLRLVWVCELCQFPAVASGGNGPSLLPLPQGWLIDWQQVLCPRCSPATLHNKNHPSPLRRPRTRIPGGKMVLNDVGGGNGHTDG